MADVVGGIANQDGPVRIYHRISNTKNMKDARSSTEESGLALRARREKSPDVSNKTTKSLPP
jgi:hypothetical protein